MTMIEPSPNWGEAKPPGRVQRTEAIGEVARPAGQQPAPSGAGGERRWQSSGDAYWQANRTMKRIPAGLYQIQELPMIGPAFIPMLNRTDDLISLDDAPSVTVLEEIRRFWELGEAFAERGLIHKRGVLLWGPPGSGKTATLQLLVGMITNQHDGIAVALSHPSLGAAALQMLRRVESTRPVVVLLEDLDALVERWGENDYLALLDGELQVPNVVFVATTNYPERLDLRFVDRPSRFDLVRYVGMPSAGTRRAYLARKEPSLTELDLARWVKESEGLSIAHLREMIILCRCYGKSLDEAVERMNHMRERRPKSTQGDDAPASTIGFGAAVGGAR